MRSNQLLWNSATVKKIRGNFSRWNRGYSHTRLRSFIFFLIHIPKLWSYSHSYGIPVPIANPRHLYHGRRLPYRAMVATVPGEKLLIWRRAVRNWTQLQFFFFISL